MRWIALVSLCIQLGCERMAHPPCSPDAAEVSNRPAADAATTARYFPALSRDQARFFFDQGAGELVALGERPLPEIAPAHAYRVLETGTFGSSILIERASAQSVLHETRWRVCEDRYGFGLLQIRSAVALEGTAWRRVDGCMQTALWSAEPVVIDGSSIHSWVMACASGMHEASCVSAPGGPTIIEGFQGSRHHAALLEGRDNGRDRALKECVRIVRDVASTMPSPNATRPAPT